MRDPYEYKDLARQLAGFVAKGTFLLLSATTPLELVVEGKWHGDSEVHRFLCSTCDREFVLYADTYHGGARWEPGYIPAPAPGKVLLQ